MTTIYGPQGWDARQAAEEESEGYDLSGVIERGREMWAALGYCPCADDFWDVVAPMMYAVAVQSPDEAGYGKGFSAATACEQLMHEIQFFRERRVLP